MGARLKQGVTLEQARTDLNTIASRLEEAYPETNAGHGTSVTLLSERLVRDVRPALLLLLVAVAFVLLIACVNVANLLLAGAAGRRQEIAIRSALGASRARIVRQVLTESIMLALAGGCLGLLLSFWAVSLFAAAGPGNIPRLREVGVDARVLGFKVILSVLTGIVFGLIPAFQTSGADLNDALKGAGRSSTGGTGRKTRSALTTAEVAISLVLLTCAGLLVRSFIGLQRTNPGFDPRHVLTMQLLPPQSKYAEDDRLVSFYKQLIEKVRGVPGIEDVGMIQALPLEGGWENTVRVEGQPPLTSSGENSVTWFIAGPGYFSTMGISLLRGRDFTESDRASSPVVIIDEATARRFFGSTEQALGKRLSVGGRQLEEVVGVVGRVKDNSLTGDPRAAVYEPFAQKPVRSMSLVIRAASDRASLTAAIRRGVRELDKELPVFGVQSMEEVIAESTTRESLTAFVFGLFALVALVLAAVGIYGVTAYMIVERTREFGIRAALGALPTDILKLVFKQALMPVMLGMTVRLGGALVAGRAISGLLYGVSGADPVAILSVSALLILVALLACLLPARRAMRVDPLAALRHDG